MVAHSHTRQSARADAAPCNPAQRADGEGLAPLRRWGVEVSRWVSPASYVSRIVEPVRSRLGSRFRVRRIELRAQKSPSACWACRVALKFQELRRCAVRLACGTIRRTSSRLRSESAPGTHSARPRATRAVRAGTPQQRAAGNAAHGGLWTSCDNLLSCTGSDARCRWRRLPTPEASIGAPACAHWVATPGPA